MKKYSIAYRHSILQQPYSKQFEVIKTFNENELIKHALVDELQVDYKDLLLTGLLLIEKFKCVEMLPVIHENDVTFRKKLLQNVKHNKNPDFRINGEYWELESPSYPYKYNNIDARIRKGSLQADRLLLYFNKAVPYTLIEKVVSDRMRLNKDLKEVVIISKNKIEMHLNKKSR